MSNTVFPVFPGVKKGSRTRMPLFETGIQTSVSGRELRTSYSAYPRWQYALEYEYLRAGQQHQHWQELVGFFLARGGDFDTWLYEDPDDHVAVDQQFGTGDGVTNQFRLLRAMGGFVEPVAALKGPATIKAGGVIVEPEINASTASVTFPAPPGMGAVLTWSGEFYFRCRFLQSKMEFKRFVSNLWSSGRIEFITVK